jgi:Tol biopolymer transport system component
MPDIRERLSVFRDLELPPDVWESATSRHPRSSVDLGPSVARRAGIIAVALAIAVGSIAFLSRAFQRAATPAAPVVTNGMIAFAGDRWRSTWLVSPDGTDLHEIPHLEGLSEVHPLVWSPDGAHLYYEADLADDNSGFHLFVSNVDGTGFTNLSGDLPLPPDDSQDFWTLSPDGSMFAFQDDGPSNYPKDMAVSGLYVMWSDGSGATRIAKYGAYQSWAPDSSRLVYVGGEDGDLFSSNADGSGVVQLTRTPDVFESWPLWSPDGSHILYRVDNYQGTETQLFVIDADGSNARAITDLSKSTISEVAWAPDGSRVVFGVIEDSGRNDYLAIANVDGSGTRVLVQMPGWESGEVWSPDGTAIAFTATPAGEDPEYGPRDLFTIYPDGSGLTRLTTGGAASHAPLAWQPRMTYASGG